SNPSGRGSANITFSVAPNPGVLRTGGFVVGGQAFTVIQVAATAGGQFTLAPTSIKIPAAGGAGPGFLQPNNPGWAWNATSNSPFLMNLLPGSGIGSGLIGFVVAANPAGGARTGTFTIAGQTFTVNQAAQAGNTQGSRFVPLMPCRIADTRNPAGPY